MRARPVQHATDPMDCESCQRLHKLTILRVSLRNEKIPVLSWCCICGLPVVLELVNDYEYSVRYFMALDDTPQAHKRVHAATGGWGIHWRLDDVLYAVFGTQHAEPLWPRPPWYDHDQALEYDVRVMTKQEVAAYAKQAVDVELRMLSEWINGRPRNRLEMEAEVLAVKMGDRVWDHNEVRDVFEILGFKKPFALAKNKVTGEKGSLLFQDNPRFYFGFSSEHDRVI